MRRDGDHGRRPRLRSAVAAVALATTATVALAPAAPAPAAETRQGGLLGGLLGGLGGLLDDTTDGLLGFRLGLFDEFAPQGTPVWPGQVRTAIRGDALARAGWDGSGVDVALIDTGAVPLPGLDAPGAVAVGPDLSFDRQSGVPAGLDGYGHGTHLAGLIAGRGDARTAGVADDARLVNLKVGATDGAVDVSQVIAAIDWAVQHRDDPGMDIRVINLSYGTDGTQPALSDPLAHAVQSAWRHGIVVVVAAGNSGEALTNPATDPYVLTVGAVDLRDPDRTGDDRVAAYSSVGTSRRRVDVVAPGTSLVSLRDPGSTIDDEHADARVGDRWFRGSGTSQAAAVVSGAVASLLEARPDLTPDQVKALLRGTARPVSGTAAAQGAGMIDLAAALGAAAPRTVQAHPASTGLGTLEGARGSAHVSLDGVALEGEVDVQGGAWVPSRWAPLATAGTAWDGGAWNGSTWTGADWTDGDTTWSGRTWRSEAWTGRTWRGDAWTGRTWRCDTWTGRTWRST